MCKRLNIIVCFFTLIFLAGCAPIGIGNPTGCLKCGQIFTGVKGGYATFTFGQVHIKPEEHLLRFAAVTSEEEKLGDFKYYAAHVCGHKNFAITEVQSFPMNYPTPSYLKGFIDCKTPSKTEPKKAVPKPASKATPKEQPTKSLTISLDEAKAQCADLGFKKGTEKFGDCVLKLSK